MKITLSSYKLYSHPDKSLLEHLKNVGDFSKQIVNSKVIPHKKIFSDISYLIGVSHDFGKSTEAFQRMLKTGERTKKANHGLISSLFGYFIVKKFLEKIGKIDEFWYIPPITWIVINKHHGNIQDIKHEIDKLRDQRKIKFVKEQIDDIRPNINDLLQIYRKLLKDFGFEHFDVSLFFDINVDFLMREIYRKVKKIKRKMKLDFYFKILFFYSVLLDSDKIDASGSKIPPRIKNLKKNIVDNYKSQKFVEKERIDNIREMAYNEVNDKLSSCNLDEDRVFSINLPTGIGKTLMGFSFALGLREKIKSRYNFEPKIIYSLPFLSIIDQNASTISEILDFNGFKINSEIPSNLFLKHHHLADIKYREMKDQELNIIEDINKSLILTEGWHSEIIMTTFVQFFHSIITNKNRAARKFHNIINAIILLDEIQSIPHKYWLLINKVLKYLAFHFNCWIILMTATRPLIFDEGELKELVKNKEFYFNSLDRVIFNFNLQEQNFNSFKKFILNEIERSDENIMVVLNTVRSSKDLYEYLKDNLCHKYDLDPEDALDEDGICNLRDLELINMSTHVLPFYRLRRIKRIRKKNNSKRKVIITTQLVEAGVDISVDVIYRDLAPLDSIIQTAGRCNRNYDEKKGEVHVLILKDENNRFFHSYIYDPILIDITKRILSKINERISEKYFTFKSANNYYHLLKERASFDDSKEIIDNLRRLNFSETSKFNLIEKLRTISIFIELNEKVKGIREKIEKILSIKDFSRKRKLRKFRTCINNFTLSINYIGKDEIFQLPSIGELEDFRYVPIENLKEWYKVDIGFQPPQTDISMRLL
ncbi:MAG: CRISPR-associated endonuclease/helicase Cas3 [Bacteroidales bacterium]|nr:CRISPR-associated endonuclease/helicase Cas3 [Bacteroidales bacterium]